MFKSLIRCHLLWCMKLVFQIDQSSLGNYWLLQMWNSTQRFSSHTSSRWLLDLPFSSLDLSFYLFLHYILHFSALQCFKMCHFLNMLIFKISSLFLPTSHIILLFHHFLSIFNDFFHLTVDIYVSNIILRAMEKCMWNWIFPHKDTLCLFICSCHLLRPWENI